MNKLSVAVKLLHMLTTNKEINSKMVQNEFEISLRTAQRHLLELADLPFVQKNDERNSYSLIDGYKIKKGILENAEYAFIKSLLNYSKSILGKENEDKINKINSKIDVSSHIIIGEIAIDYDNIAQTHSRLERAIADSEKIEFLYTKYDKKYMVDPYSIIFNDGYWYLAAGHDGLLKKFVLDYITDIKNAGTYLFIPDNFAEVLKKPQSIWFEQGKTITAKIKVSPLAAEYIKRRALTAGQIIEEEFEDGSAIIKFETANEMEFFQIIVRWIDNIEVLEPKEYREFLKVIGEKVINLNKDID